MLNLNTRNQLDVRGGWAWNIRSRMRAFQYQQIPVFSYPSVSTTVSRLTKKPTTGQADVVKKEHDWDAITQVPK